MTATMGDFLRQIRRNYSALAPSSDPSEEFLTAQARSALEAWIDLWPELLGPDTEGEPALQKIGRIKNAQTRAEEIVRAEYLMPPQDEQISGIPGDAVDEVGALMAELRGVHDDVLWEEGPLDDESLAALEGRE